MFAYRAGLVPDGATKQTHKRERDICKIGLLGMNYGMGAQSLAAGTGLSLIQAQSLHRQLKRTYDQFQRWSQGSSTPGCYGVKSQRISVGVRRLSRASR